MFSEIISRCCATLPATGCTQTIVLTLILIIPDYNPHYYCDWYSLVLTTRGGGLGSRPKKMYGGWGRVPFNEPYAPSLSIIYDGA